MPKDLCIAIAVSRPDGLDEVPGAIPSAERLITWAGAQGYDTTLVTDAAEPVTCSRLHRVFTEKLGEGGQRRIIVSFAGHGLIRGGAEEYWLLTDWRTKAIEAVNHLKLRDRLGTYLPRQLAVISDACRSLPTDRAKWVEGNGIVDVKDYVEQPVQVAQLTGTRASQPAFATPLGQEEAYCFFSRVLVNALCGQPSDVVETDAKIGRVVFNDRLFSVVERELPLLASRYRCSQVPDLQGGWRTTPSNVWSVVSLASPVPPPPKLPPKDPDPHESEGREMAAESRASRFEDRLRNQRRATHFETGSGLVVDGVPLVTDVVTSPQFFTERDSDQPNWFRLYPRGGDATSILARLENGVWVGAAAYAGFIGTFGIGPDGADSYVLRSIGQDLSTAEQAIAQAATGGAFSDPFELAARLRDHKHADPVLGALAAYAYARAGAVEEIRRLCYFYASACQPAPFDAILLARVPIRREGLNYFAEIPAVSGREPRSPAEEQREFTYRPTPAARVSLAGLFPWLRQGWALLEDDFRPQFRRLAAFARDLRPSLFTSLSPSAGDELAFHLKSGEI